MFNKKHRPLEIFDSKRFNWSKTRNEVAAIKYVTKEYLAGLTDKIWARWWKIPYRMVIKNMHWWQKDLVDIIDNPIDNRKIYWYWEPKGCSGKTTFCKWVVCNYPDTIAVGGRSVDMKHGVMDFIKTNGKPPKIILVDIPRCAANRTSYEGIEEVKDMFFFSSKYEGGMVCGDNPHVIIFANETPKLQMMSDDRWTIVNIS